jgi:anti-sigma-K factor RskA
MSEIGHNGSSQEAWTMPPDSHEEFQELCALSLTGELTQEERARLDSHLIHCADCREALRQYERIVATEIPALGAEFYAEQDDGNAAGSWSIEMAEKRLMQSLPRQVPSPRVLLMAQKISWQRHAPRLAMAAAVVIACSLAGYLVGILHERGLRPPPTPAPGIASLHSDPQNQNVQPVTPRVAETPAPKQDQTLQARSEFRRNEQELRRINEELEESEDALAKEKAGLDRSEQERADLARQLSEVQANAQSLEARLHAIGDQTSRDTVQSLELKAQVHDLNNALEEKDREIAREQALLQQDRDIRNLIGARNLYIAEIYDVAKTGDTQKPFGRVFYTKDKSLIFYGYDLDQQGSVKKDSTFQAWGRRGSGQEHDISLGLLYQDDSNKKRWVLKLNDAKTIAQIDAVFVTVEPEGGSTKPSGKPLLFTYLRLDPNHP